MPISEGPVFFSKRVAVGVTYGRTPQREKRYERMKTKSVLGWVNLRPAGLDLIQPTECVLIAVFFFFLFRSKDLQVELT